MKNRDVKKIIREKAKKKSIPDVSFLIKEKLDMDYQYQEEIVTVKKPFNLRPLYMSLAASMLVIFVIVLTLITPTPSVDLFANSDFSDNVLLSAISTNELIEKNEINANYNFEFKEIIASTSFTYNEQPNEYVEDELDEVMKYSSFIEIFFNNLEEFEKEIKKEKYLSFNKVITYQLNNLNRTMSEYKLHYKQNINKEEKTYLIDGLLVIDQKEYSLTITGNTLEDSFILTHLIDEDKTIQVLYEEGQIKIKEYYQENSVNESIIDLKETEVKLSFIKGKNQGVYQFQMDKTNNKKRIRIDYQIGNSDQGELDFAVSEDDNDEYEINIKPNDRPPSSIKKERKQKGKSQDDLDKPGNPSEPGDQNGPNEPGNPNNPGGPKGPRGPKDKGSSNNKNSK